MMRNTRIVVLATVFALVAASCGDEGGEETTTSTATETTVAAETTEPDETTTTSPPPAGPAVSVAGTELGDVLVDPDGLTLYIFTNDSEGQSVCNDACAATWPPVAANVAIDGSLDAAMFGSATRDDGSAQLTVNGQPLYTFSGDSAPGEVNGHGLNGVWFVVDSQGNPVEAS